MKLNNFIYNNIKKNRIVRNKFNRAVKKLHSVKYKISLKEITEDLNTGIPRDIVGLVPDHHNKVSTTIKQVTQIFWFPGVYKSYVYTIL